MEFTVRATQSTITNQDGATIVVREGDDDSEILEIHINGESFWMTKKDAKKVAAEITKIASGG